MGGRIASSSHLLFLFTTQTITITNNASRITRTTTLPTAPPTIAITCGAASVSASCTPTVVDLSPIDVRSVGSVGTMVSVVVVALVEVALEEVVIVGGGLGVTPLKMWE